MNDKFRENGEERKTLVGREMEGRKEMGKWKIKKKLELEEVRREGEWGGGEGRGRTRGKKGKELGREGD